MANNRWPQLYPTRRFGRSLERGLRGLERWPLMASWLAPTQHTEASDEELTVVMTLHPKDLWIAQEALLFAEKNVLHPIREILIISPDSEEVSQWARGAGYRWVSESEVPTLSLSKIQETLPAYAANRDTWIYQQLLKLAADSLVTTDNYLILDADTLLLQPRVFKKGNQRWLDYSHERNLLYLKSYRHLLGQKPRLWPSYVCHHLFVEKAVLASLKKAIEEKVSLPWAEAIVATAGGDFWTEKDKGINPFNFFSEYEVYNNWLLNQAGDFHFQYFRNHAPREFEPENLDLKAYVSQLPSFYQWASFHSYYRKE